MYNQNYSYQELGFNKAPYNKGFNQNQNVGFTPNNGSIGSTRKSSPIGSKTLRDGRSVPVYKHSGAKSGIDKKGGRYTNGWMTNKRVGMVSFFCAPTKNTTAVMSKTGNSWLTCIAVKVQFRDLMKEELHWGLMHEASGKVIIQSLGLVVNPKAPNGGFSGKYGKK